MSRANRVTYVCNVTTFLPQTRTQSPCLLRPPANLNTRSRAYRKPHAGFTGVCASAQQCFGQPRRSPSTPLDALQLFFDIRKPTRPETDGRSRGPEQVSDDSGHSHPPFYKGGASLPPRHLPCTTIRENGQHYKLQPN